MTKVSDDIENAVIANRGVADLHVSFQYLSRVLPQKIHYQEVAKSAKGVWLYGIPDVPLTEFNTMPRTTLIDTSGTLLEKYWFVVAYSAGN